MTLSTRWRPLVPVTAGCLLLASCSDGEPPAPLPPPSPSATDTRQATEDATTAATSATEPDAAPVSREPVPPGVPITEDIPAATWTMYADWPELEVYPSRDLDRATEVQIGDGCTASGGVNEMAAGADALPVDSPGDLGRAEAEGFDAQAPTVDLRVQNDGAADIEGIEAVGLLTLVPGAGSDDGSTSQTVSAARPLTASGVTLFLTVSCTGEGIAPESVEALLAERAAGVLVVATPLED